MDKIEFFVAVLNFECGISISKLCKFLKVLQQSSNFAAFY